jgi:hypothetical protein
MANHKHFDIIKAWREGHKIETYLPCLGLWVEDKNPHFSPDTRYRIKWEKPEYRELDILPKTNTEQPQNNSDARGLNLTHFWVDEICDWSDDVVRSTIIVYDYVKLFKFKNDCFVGSDEEHSNNVKYTFDADTYRLISVEMI